MIRRKWIGHNDTLNYNTLEVIKEILNLKIQSKFYIPLITEK